MTNLVEFPGLGLEFNISRVAFTIFGIDIYWYGICIGLGMLLALVMAFRECKPFGLDVDRVIDVIFVGLIGAIVGGRLYFVIFIDQSYQNFYQLIDLRSGGIAIYGAIIGAFAGAAVACKLRKVPMLPLFDLAGMGFLIGQCLGRWGNFFNQEAFGTNTTMPWGMISPATTSYLTQQQATLATYGIDVNPALPVHPTFLYESLWCALGFILLFSYRKKRKFHGELFLFYIMWYGFGRFFIEGLRTDPLMIKGLGIPVSQLLAGLSVLAGLAVWIMAKVKTAGKPLVVPELPMRTAKVKVEQEGAQKTVAISWPGSWDEPSKEKKREMALEKLKEEEQKTAPDKKAPDAETEEDEAGSGTKALKSDAGDSEELVLDKENTVTVKPTEKADVTVGANGDDAVQKADKAEEKLRD